MQKLVFFILMLMAGPVISCECPPLAPLTVKAVDLYDAVFLGTVDSVSPCNTKGAATAYFSVDQAYKGSLKKQVKVDFDCSSACMMSFMKNEKWLIYARYQRFDQLVVNICSYSRKYFADSQQDFYEAATMRSFKEEKEFLEKNIGQQPIAVDSLAAMEEDLRPRNEQPSPYSKLWLLLISFGAMAAVYLYTRLKK